MGNDENRSMMETIHSFVAYKNNIGIDNYGLANVVYDYAMVLDNGLGTLFIRSNYIMINIYNL